jgi:membrane fusion protein (multidrug efflux system)
MKRFIVGFIVLLLVGIICAGLVWFNFFRDKMIAQFFANFPIPTVTVSTIEVKPQTWSPGIEAVGTVTASRGVEVSSQVPGIIKSIEFKANDKVAQGKLLVQIDDSIERSKLSAAESTLQVVQDALDRAQQLFKRNFATSADLQAAQNKLDLAKGDLEALRATLAQKQITAPFAGVVGIPKIDVGQYVQAGTAFATLQDLDKMKVDFTIPEQQLPQVKLGQALVIGLTADHMDYAGTITGIDPKIDPSSRLVSVQAVVDNPNDELRPGQFVRVRVKLPEEPSVIALPQTAVVLSLYGSFVYQVVEAPPPAAPAGQGAAAQGGQAPAAGGAPAAPAGPQLVAKQIFVETGRRSATDIEVIKGVDPGMQIVTSGQNKLSNGSHVAVDNSVDPAKTASAAK